VFFVCVGVCVLSTGICGEIERVGGKEGERERG
jgi:hypothetical protein